MTTNIPLQYHRGLKKVSTKLASSRAQITARPAQAISSPRPPRLLSFIFLIREFPSQPLQSVMEKPLKLWMFTILSANAEVGAPPAYLILLISLSKHMVQEKGVSTRRNLLIAQKKAM